MDRTTSRCGSRWVVSAGRTTRPLSLLPARPLGTARGPSLSFPGVGETRAFVVVAMVLVVVDGSMVFMGSPVGSVVKGAISSDAHVSRAEPVTTRADAR